MRILITGAFGNIGIHTVEYALNLGHFVRCFDILTPINKKRAKKFAKRAEIIWGDLRNPENISDLILNIDAVIHLAAIIPPISERNIDLTRSVNVIGTQNIINAIRELPKECRLVFTSSISVFGDTQKLTPPRKVTDPTNPTDNYSKTKIDCEKLIQDSLTQWTICRLAAAAPIELKSFDPIMFDIPLSNRIEFVYPGDIARALINALETPLSLKKVFLIGGGPSCQMFYRDYVNRILDAFGIGRLPEKAFQTTGAFYTDWLDTSESQQILQYQQTSFETYAQEIGTKIGLLHIIIEFFREIIKLWILNKSRYYRSKPIRVSKSIKTSI